LNKLNVFVTGLLAGALVGAIAGALLTPKEGKEIRKLLGSRTEKLRNRAMEQVDDIRGRFGKDPEEEIAGDRSENGTSS